MKPAELGQKYDQIATWWQSYHQDSGYGVKYLCKALQFLLNPDNSSKHSGASRVTGCAIGGTTSTATDNSELTALDVGCGAGGRFIKVLEEQGCSVTGVDVSQVMIELATFEHSLANDQGVLHRFIHADICDWQPDHSFDVIYAWDSIFHLPLQDQIPVLNKLCRSLKPGGVILYTFGNDVGEHTDTWEVSDSHSDEFYYSSVGIDQNVETLVENGLTVMHLELDQYPEKHVIIIAQKR